MSWTAGGARETGGAVVVNKGALAADDLDVWSFNSRGRSTSIGEKNKITKSPPCAWSTALAVADRPLEV